ncbi:hypothetical protein [Actinophytocola sp.]|uniref:hypothetical protein n=1 Tax=Actinophytocola sp. TaxID=1872138 RepID=UPI002D800CFD|nr:hypothetical protein [Actinophytocola sp.]HET9142568.1 hypothetical protein [Actinophytocola sp.]
MPSGAALRRAREWLSGHRLDVEPTPLVVGRLEARRRGKRAEFATDFVCWIGIVVWMMLDGNDDRTIVDHLQMIVWILTLIAGMLIGAWWQRRLESPLLAGLRTRAAHPAAASLERVLGRGHLYAAVGIFGGGLVLGAALTVLAPSASTRSLALVFLSGVAVLGAAGAVALATTLRRPALAEDPESLLVDDALRTEDARRAIWPYPLAIVLGFGLDPAVGGPASLALLVYLVVGVAWCVVVDHLAKRAPTVQPVVR